jgi:4-hydroxybenzoate polyprenyltransferase
MALSFAAFITFLYSAPKIPQNLFKQLKDIAVGKTIFLALVWMFVTTLLPVFSENHSLVVADLVFAVSRFCLIYSICILFDYRDREDDKKEGIRSMITYLTEKGIDRLFFLTLLVFLISTVCMAFCGFSGKLILILLVPGLMTALLYRRARKDFSDYLYYFVLDGLMMLSSAVTLFNYF